MPRGFLAKAVDFFHRKIQDDPRPTPEQQFVPENPANKNLRRVELCKNAKTIRGISRNTKPQKNAQHFPLKLAKILRRGGGGRVRCRGFSESSGVFSGQLSEFKIPYTERRLLSCKRQSNPAYKPGLEGPPKKKPGAGNRNKCV